MLAPTLPGHAGGPPLARPVSDAALVDWLERMLDEAGLDRVHVAGNSMGGYLALLLAERGRALSVVALAPGGGWAKGDDGYLETLAFFEEMQGLVRAAAPHADAIMRSENGRRRASEYITTRFEHLPADLLAHQLVGAAACGGAQELIDVARREGWNSEPERIAAPVRIVWGTDDRVLPWPRAAELYRERLPHADWVVLESVGHSPQLDVPLEAAELILGWTAGS